MSKKGSAGQSVVHQSSEQSFGLSVSALLREMKKNNWTAKQLEFRCGFPDRTISHIINGHAPASRVANWRVGKMADALGVLIGDLFDQQPIYKRKRLPAPDDRTTVDVPPGRCDFDTFGDEMLRTSEMWLTMTRCSHTYFMPDDMYDWFMRDSYLRLGWTTTRIEKRLEVVAPVLKSDREGHQRYKMKHWHLMRAKVFQDAYRVNPEWLSEIDDSEKASHGAFKIYPASEAAFSHFDEQMSQFGYHGCCCIEVIDTKAALICPMCAGRQHLVLDKTKVTAIRDIIWEGIRELKSIAHRKLADRALVDR